MSDSKLTSAESKTEIVRLVGIGKTIGEACKIVGKSRATYDYYRRTDAEFANAIDNKKIMAARGKSDSPTVEVPDFPEFCERYLGQKLFYHQLQWFDLLEGREPRDMHPSMFYEKGDQDLLIVNTPPGHAKSTTLTVNYTVWRIVQDPNVKIVLVSKTEKLAAQFLLQVKSRLTHQSYSDLQRDFAPPGGWHKDSASWKQNLIYVSGNVRSGEAKDPTVQALGMGGQLYGARADLIILDDTVDNDNAHQFEKQVQWIQTEVMTRLPDGGKLFVVGTRLTPRDLYLELRDPNRYHGEDVSPWTYFSQPAVLEFAEKLEDWVTLWPYTDAASGRHVIPNADGLYTKWTGPILAKRRGRMTPSRWARVFQQEQVAEDTVFKPEDISASQQMRSAGLIPDDEHIGRNGGMSGLYLVAGLDPAAVGHTAAVLLGVEQRTGKRYVIDVFNKPAITPDEMRSLIKDWTVKYSINEWRIERNAFQRFLTLDSEINQFLAARGCILNEHTTGNNKNDENFGVMAMAGLFSQRLIMLPNNQSEAVKAMVEQLLTWQPDAPRGTKTDIVMALWFAELRALELVNRNARKGLYTTSEFTTRGDIMERQIVRASDAEFATPNAWWGS